jgi:hypothetical protein
MDGRAENASSNPSRPGSCRQASGQPPVHMAAVSDKRRSPSPISSPSKKRKTAHISLDDLSWKSVVCTRTAGLDFDDGLLDLEEVGGVQVVYEQTANGRVATFLVRVFSSIYGRA